MTTFPDEMVVDLLYCVAHDSPVRDGSSPICLYHSEYASPEPCDIGRATGKWVREGVQE